MLTEYPQLLADPRSLRQSYLEQFERFAEQLKLGCRSQNIDYVQLNTETRLDVALSSYLAHRLPRLR